MQNELWYIFQSHVGRDTLVCGKCEFNKAQYLLIVDKSLIPQVASGMNFHFVAQMVWFPSKIQITASSGQSATKTLCNCVVEGLSIFISHNSQNNPHTTMTLA